ncbi:hypothetical protein X769_32915 [Mesorhizobium sp. LSJC268A00]|nr:hypothetical protein X769_32915 [Mesorhizobium sp. LSJC268A00]
MAGAGPDHVQCGYPFGMPVSQCQAGVDQQAMAVLQTHEAQLGFLAFALPIKPGIGIASQGMCVVRVLMAMEVRFAFRQPPASGSPEPSFL